MARANWVLINKPNLARAVDACANADLVVSKFWSFYNFNRSYFRFRSVDFFHFFGDSQDQLAAYIVRFLKNSVGRKKNKRTMVKKRIFS